MEASAGFLVLSIVAFLASSGTSGFITYSMVQDVNRKRGKEQKPLKWNRDLIGIISEYRATCPQGKLMRPLVIALLFVLLTGAALWVAFSQLGRNPQ
jgi:hypothetical protein